MSPDNCISILLWAINNLEKEFWICYGVSSNKTTTIQLPLSYSNTDYIILMCGMAQTGYGTFMSISALNTTVSTFKTLKYTPGYSSGITEFTWLTLGY